MKMKMKVETKVISEVEVTLPIYRKNGGQAFKVFSEQECIWVSASYRPSISISHSGLAWNTDETVDCTESEFMEIYNKAMIELKSHQNYPLTRRDMTKEDLVNMLEDVVNQLALSEIMIEKHGPLGTPPAELVRLILEEKDLKINALKQEFAEIKI